MVNFFAFIYCSEWKWASAGNVGFSSRVVGVNVFSSRVQRREGLFQGSFRNNSGVHIRIRNNYICILRFFLIFRISERQADNIYFTSGLSDSFPLSPFDLYPGMNTYVVPRPFRLQYKPRYLQTETFFCLMYCHIVS